MCCTQHVLAFLFMVENWVFLVFHKSVQHGFANTNAIISFEIECIF